MYTATLKPPLTEAHLSIEKRQPTRLPTYITVTLYSTQPVLTSWSLACFLYFIPNSMNGIIPFGVPRLHSVSCSLYQPYTRGAEPCITVEDTWLVDDYDDDDDDAVGLMKRVGEYETNGNIQFNLVSILFSARLSCKHLLQCC